ncbi:hypothetical protein C0J52_13988 [Blattella germanica]|nr:hypothetical protein C0J52_13988 [Blattella germanica]
MTHATRALQSQDLSGEDRLWITYTIIFFTTQGHGGPPWISVSSMPGPPPRQHEHIDKDTIHTHTHTNKANMMKMIMMAR